MAKNLIDRIVISKANQPEFGIVGNYYPLPTTEDNEDLVRLLENWPSGKRYYDPFVVDTEQPNVKYVYKIIKTQRVANRNIYTLERKEIHYMLFGVNYTVEDSRRYLMIYDFPGEDQVVPPAPDMSNYTNQDNEIEECDFVVE